MITLKVPLILDSRNKYLQAATGEFSNIKRESAWVRFWYNERNVNVNMRIERMDGKSRPIQAATNEGIKRLILVLTDDSDNPNTIYEFNLLI